MTITMKMIMDWYKQYAYDENNILLKYIAR